MTAAAQAPEVLGEHASTRDDLIEDVRRLYGSGTPDLFDRLGDLIRRRLGVGAQGPAAFIVAGLVGSGTRLAAALLATAAVGQWSEVPWGRWAVIIAFYALFGAQQVFWHTEPVASWSRRVVDDWTALVPTIERESDLRDLAGRIRGWNRLGPATAVAVAVAATMLLGAALVAPGSLAELPVGSLVLLAFVLHDFGLYPIYWGNLLNGWAMAREAHYDHHLFWASPADSPEVHQALRKTTNQGSAAGFWITIFLVLTVVLVSWESPLVLPLAVGFVLIGYLSTIGTAVSGRASVRRIVDGSRRRRLAALQDRIEAFEPRLGDLSHQEAQRLRDLLQLHNAIRDAPTTPTTARTVLSAAAGLILPTIMFAITVFGEVSAERLLDRLLP